VKGVDWMRLVQDSEKSNEPLGSIKGGEFFD
jgi:hypothetical protein